jgi:hypothetical protein
MVKQMLQFLLTMAIFCYGCFGSGGSGKEKYEGGKQDKGMTLDESNL